MSYMKSVKFEVLGKVQGVFFRKVHKIFGSLWIPIGYDYRCGHFCTEGSSGCPSQALILYDSPNR